MAHKRKLGPSACETDGDQVSKKALALAVKVEGDQRGVVEQPPKRAKIEPSQQQKQMGIAMTGIQGYDQGFTNGFSQGFLAGLNTNVVVP